MYIHKLSMNLILAFEIAFKSNIYQRKAKESAVMLEIYLCKCSLIVHCMFCLQYIRCNLNILQEAQWCLALQPITFLKRSIKSFSLAWKLSYILVYNGSVYCDISLCGRYWYCTVIMWCTCIPPSLYIIEWSKQYVIHGVVNVFSLNGQWFILHTLDKMILICIHLKVFKKSLTVQWIFIFLYKISKFYRFIIFGSMWFSRTFLFLEN